MNFERTASIYLCKKIKILIVRCHDEHDEIKVIIISSSIQKIDFVLISIFDNLIVVHCQW